jgi:hypothetical protein
MSKTYKLKKDLPGFPAGFIITVKDDGYPEVMFSVTGLNGEVLATYRFSKSLVTTDKEWFEEVAEEEPQKYRLNKHLTLQYAGETGCFTIPEGAIFEPTDYDTYRCGLGIEFPTEYVEGSGKFSLVEKQLISE